MCVGGLVLLSFRTNFSFKIHYLSFYNTWLHNEIKGSFVLMVKNLHISSGGGTIRGLITVVGVSLQLTVSFGAAELSV